MRPASFATTVGSTGAERDGREVVVTHEPEVGATLRTRGRFYLLLEIDPPSRSASEIAADVAETARHDYYYDLSAGVEVGLRRALRHANRRAAQLVRDQRGRVHLHLACAVVVNNEVHAARIGSAQIFLVRHARLFVPGDEPGDLADFVHRTTTREAASVGSETDLLPAVWRQNIDSGDTIVLATGSVVETLGAEALKNAAVTLHPRAAARHIRDQAVAEGISGSSATIFIEIAPAAGAAARLGSAPAPEAPPPEVAIAEGIRSRADAVMRLRPRPERAVAAVLRAVGRSMRSAVGVALELMPRRQPELPRRPETARRRALRAQRATSLLALLLLVVTIGIGAAVVRDYQADQVVNDYRLAIVDVGTDIAATRSFAGRDDSERAWQRLDSATARLAVAAGSPAADAARIAQLREEIAALGDRLNKVIIDLARSVTSAAPSQLTQTVNGLYAVDPSAGRLWRIFGDPVRTGVVLQRGQADVGTPLAVSADEAALLVLDDGRKLWRAEGDTVQDLGLPGTDSWKGATGLATFAGNVYVLDAASGQLWRYEEDFAGKLTGPVAFLPQPLPVDSARAVAVDGDIWILTSSGELQRYRRQGSDRTLTRLPLTLQWVGEPLRPTQVQALESQRSIWLLDAPARTVAQVTRDGRELARFTLPERLPAATAFFVSEGQRLAYSAHGSKISETDVSR